MTRKLKWQITGGLYVLAWAAVYFGLRPTAPEWAHGIGLPCLIYGALFPLVAGGVWLAYEPPRSGPSLERSGVDG